jgi:hypothetical protein
MLRCCASHHEKRAMSALGHKQTPVITYATSASPLKADMREPAWICPLRAKRVPMHCSKTHSYSITSKAMASSRPGTSSPSPLAGLITNSNFVSLSLASRVGPFQDLRARSGGRGAIDAPRDADGKIDVAATMQLITAIVERWTREHPEQLAVATSPLAMISNRANHQARPAGGSRLG